MSRIDAPLTGADLRAARERLGWDLDAVASGLRIRRPFLEAIEEGRMGDLPGPTYAIGFVRTYAGALGLDPEEMARRFRTEAGSVVESKTRLAFPEPVPERGVPAGAVVLIALVLGFGGYVAWHRWSAQTDMTAESVPPVPDRLLADATPPPAAPAPNPSAPNSPTSNPPAPNLPAPNPPVAAAPVPAASAPAASAPSAAPPSVPPAPRQSAAIAPVPEAPASASPASASPASASPAPVSPAPASPAPAPAQAGAAPLPSAAVPSAPASPPGVAPPQAAAVAPPPIVVVPQGPSIPPSSAAAAVPPPAAAAPDRLVVRAAADAWLNIRSRQGTTLLNRVLREGETWVAPEDADLTLLVMTTGNAGGTEIVLEGAPIGPLGANGAVRRDISLDPARLREIPAPAARPAAPPAPQ